MTAWPWAHLRPFGYGAIVADPPWPTDVWGAETGHGRTPERHYPTLSIETISALPVEILAAEDCALFLWFRAIQTEAAHAVARAWGFEPKTLGIWQKLTRSGRPAMGMGYIHRNSFEPYLIATRGRPRWSSRSTLDSFSAPRREHSRKPDEFYARLAKMLPGIPGCELFGVEPHAGMDLWAPHPHRCSEAAR